MSTLNRKRNIQSVVTRAVLTQPQAFSFKDLTNEVRGRMDSTVPSERIELVCKNTLRVLRNSNKVKVLPDELYELNTRLPSIRYGRK